MIFWIVIAWAFIGYFLASAFIFIQIKKIEILESESELLDQKARETEEMRDFFVKEARKTRRLIRWKQAEIIISACLAGPYYWLKVAQRTAFKTD